MSRFKCKGTDPPRETVTLRKEKNLPRCSACCHLWARNHFLQTIPANIFTFSICVCIHLYNKDYKQQFSSRATTTVIGPNIIYIILYSMLCRSIYIPWASILNFPISMVESTRDNCISKTCKTIRAHTERTYLILCLIQKVICSETLPLTCAW